MYKQGDTVAPKVAGKTEKATALDPPQDGRREKLPGKVMGPAGPPEAPEIMKKNHPGHYDSETDLYPLEIVLDTIFHEY